MKKYEENKEKFKEGLIFIDNETKDLMIISKIRTPDICETETDKSVKPEEQAAIKSLITGNHFRCKLNVLEHYDITILNEKEMKNLTFIKDGFQKKLFVSYLPAINKYVIKKMNYNLLCHIYYSDEKECLRKLQNFIKKEPNCLVLQDPSFQTSDLQQKGIKMIIQALNPAENLSTYGDGELLEFYNEDQALQFIVGRPELSQAMICNDDQRTVDALLSDYKEDPDEAVYVSSILSEYDYCLFRELDSELEKEEDLEREKE